MCHNSLKQFPYCWTHSSFSYFNIHRFAHSLAWKPSGLLLPWFICMSHAVCLPCLDPLLPHSVLGGPSEVCALETFAGCRSGSPRNAWLTLHRGNHRRQGWRCHEMGVRNDPGCCPWPPPAQDLQKSTVQDKEVRLRRQRPRRMVPSSLDWDGLTLRS